MMGVDTFRTARMLARRPSPEDFLEWCRFRQDPRKVTHADLPHVLLRLTAAEWHRGPVRERFPLG
ncbi:hypothetical protein ATI61_109422 [Archangium gephyra]|uniref:Uncharacterized protein n=1 Tax=Archangium gephyra TaxID=48 RepID=A0AAC8Q205_9BACT|nr:hypothetical protein [Archangium gephyra]AKI99375.1 Hypothetical protein AA314_01002 [Archangium gephyra]REG28078.1 hypothetical protein ATI61_109422 [Archangium gephyra]